MAVDSAAQERQEALELMLLEIDELPTIPESLVEILRIIDEPTTGASDLARVVRLDPPLAAKILRLANSPFYGLGHEVTEISRCIAVLGYRTVRSVAITLPVASNLLSAVARTRGRLDYREIWRHSVVTGAVARHLGILVHDPVPEEIFAAGLLHDLGKFVLALHAPEHEPCPHADAETQVVQDLQRATHADLIPLVISRSGRYRQRMLNVEEDHQRRADDQVGPHETTTMIACGADHENSQEGCQRQK